MPFPGRFVGPRYVLALGSGSRTAFAFEMYMLPLASLLVGSAADESVCYVCVIFDC